MKRFLATLALTCALSSVALAGDMPTCGGSAPAPCRATQSSSITTDVLLAIISLVVG
jgi:hypothetical protein